MIHLLKTAPIQIERFQFIGFNGRTSYCDLYIWPHINLVIIKNLPILGNGTSPIMAVEILCEQIIKQFKINPKKLTWINYCPDSKEFQQFPKLMSAQFKFHRTSLWSKNFKVIGNANFDDVKLHHLSDIISEKISLNSNHLFA